VPTCIRIYIQIHLEVAEITQHHSITYSRVTAMAHSHSRAELMLALIHRVNAMDHRIDMLGHRVGILFHGVNGIRRWHRRHLLTGVFLQTKTRQSNDSTYTLPRVHQRAGPIHAGHQTCGQPCHWHTWLGCHASSHTPTTDKET